MVTYEMAGCEKREWRNVFIYKIYRRLRIDEITRERAKETVNLRRRSVLPRDIVYSTHLPTRAGIDGEVYGMHGLHVAFYTQPPLFNPREQLGLKSRVGR